MNKFAAYIRVSDKNRASGESQAESIRAYAEKKGIVIDAWVEEFVSASKTDIQDRQLMKLVETGYSIIMTDATRLGRRKAFSLFGVIGRICDGGELHFSYTEKAITPENADDAETLFSIVGASYAAIEEGKRRSERAKAGHATRKQKGLKSGRLKGAVIKSKLDKFAPLIIAEINKGTKKTAILEKLEKKGCSVSRQQLYNWMAKKLDKEQLNLSV